MTRRLNAGRTSPQAGALTGDVLLVTGRKPLSFREFAEREAGQWAPAQG